jgi:hypothetical protein
VFAGTLVRLFAVSIATGVLGYVLIGVIKGKIGVLWLPLPVVLTLAVLFLALPLQIKEIGSKEQTNSEESKS